MWAHYFCHCVSSIKLFKLLSKILRRFLQRSKRWRVHYPTIYHATSQKVLGYRFWHKVKKSMDLRCTFIFHVFDLVLTLLFECYIQFLSEGSCSKLTSVCYNISLITLKWAAISIADEANNNLRISQTHVPNKAPVTPDRIEPPNVKRIRIFVIRWQKVSLVEKPKLRTFMHRTWNSWNVPVTNMKRTASVQQANYLRISDAQQTNMYRTIRTRTGCITDKSNTERTSTGPCRIQQGIFANAFFQQTSFRKFALRTASPQCLVEEKKNKNNVPRKTKKKFERQGV